MKGLTDHDALSLGASHGLSEVSPGHIADAEWAVCVGRSDGAIVFICLKVTLVCSLRVGKEETALIMVSEC